MDKKKTGILKKRILFPSQSSGRYAISHLPFTWLISSILFFLIASVIAPVFWLQLDQADKPAEHSTLNILLGISGMIVYVLEPFIWHNSIYPTEEDKQIEIKENTDKKESWPSFIISLIISTALGLLLVLPYVAILIFKPVLRAMILYVSLSFLNMGSGNLGESPLFVLLVVSDIFLYYMNMIAPKWKLNPVNLLSSLIKFKNRSKARFTGSLLLIIHTALIYTLLLNVVYYDIHHHPEKLNLKNLAMWWLFLTVYSRLSFITDDFDVAETLKNTPRKILVINVLALALTFIGFIWPFYFA